MFNRLLLDCLDPGKTGLGEKKSKLVLTRVGDETILAFRLDSNHGRNCLGLGRGAKAADGLFAVFRSEGRPVLLFVELKGSDISRGMQQLHATIDAAKKVLGSDWKHFDTYGVVVLSGASPKGKSDVRRMQKEFLSRFDAKVTHISPEERTTIQNLLKRFP